MADELNLPNRTIEQAFELWFTPEIERRQEAGQLPKPFGLWAAQVILDVDSAKPVVYLNEEVRGVFEADAPPQVPADRIVSKADLGAIHRMDLGSDHPNASHLTVVVHLGKWHLFFDFRYNAARIQRHLDLAAEFLETAKTAVAADRRHAVVENLFAAVELMAKCHLLMLPDGGVVKAKSHGFVQTRFNLGTRRGFVRSTAARLLNRLTKLRAAARYANGNLDVTRAEIAVLLKDSEGMRSEVEAIRPKRTRVKHLK